LSALIVPLETTRAGLIVKVVDVAVRVTGTDSGVTGLVDVLRTINWGLDRVTCKPLYVPAGTELATLRMFVKSTRWEKSTVAGAVDEISETGVPPL
jgi:hypothetical protein